LLAAGLASPAQAIESLCKLSNLARDEVVQRHFLPVIQRMASGEFFTSRTSTCGLFATVYPRVTPDQQDQLRGYARSLSRRHACARRAI